MMEVTTVMQESMGPVELLRKWRGEAKVGFLREVVAVLVRVVMEVEVTEKTGAGYGERTPERVTQRNGYRPLPWDMRVGTLELALIFTSRSVHDHWNKLPPSVSTSS